MNRTPRPKGELDDRVGPDRGEPIVYFVQCVATGLIKIGSTGDYGRRLQLLESQSPVPLVEVGFIRAGSDAEAEIHHVFRDSRHHGEWFSPTPELLAFIEQHSAVRSEAASWLTARTAETRRLIHASAVDRAAWIHESARRRIYGPSLSLPNGVAPMPRPRPSHVTPLRSEVDALVSELISVDPVRMHPASRLIDDLQMDSLDLAEITVALEDVFDIELRDETVKAWVKVGDIYRTLGVQVDA